MRYILVDSDTKETIASADTLVDLHATPFTEVMVLCDICGAYEYLTDVVEFDGNFYCESCRDDKLVMCERCGEWHYKEDVYRVRVTWSREEYWCEWCKDDHSTTCERCGDCFSDDYFSLINCHGSWYCEDCSDDIYYCHECGNCFWEDEVSYCEEDDDYYCDECYNELMGDRSDEIRQYHSRPNMRYYTGTGNEDYTNDNPNFKGFGIELEIDTYARDNEQEAVDMLNDTLGDHVYYNRDGSLEHGFEIITQPHTREALTNLNWDKALPELVRLKYLSHNIKTCGLHMHVSRNLFGDTEQERTENIAKIIQFYNLFWNDILKFSRRTEAQAYRWAKRYFGVQTKEQTQELVKKDRYALDREYDYSARYHAVNLTNTNTIEFRLMRGTLNYKTFMATLDFLMTIAENSKKVTNVTSLKQWLDGIDNNTKEYIATRKCFGYSNNNNNQETQGDEE